jgi:hypothetical protein
MLRHLSALLVLCVAMPASAGFEASSFKRESKLGKNHWNAGAALDAKLDTCWQVDPEQENVGQWIQLDVPLGTVDKLGAVIGWDRDENTFFDHARVKKAKIEVTAKKISGEVVAMGEGEASFEDKRGWQVVDVPDVKVEGEYLSATVKITVLEVYEGKDYPNLAVSEFRVHLKEFEADSLAFGATMPSSEAEGHLGFDMMDGDKRTFWSATAPTGTFSLVAPGYGLASVGIMPGPASHARPKTVKLVNQAQEVVHTLQDKPGEMQWLLLPTMVGYTGGSWGEITVEVVDSYPGSDASAGVAISEVKVNGASVEEF